MVSDFRKQTPETVLKFLQRMGSEAHVFSKHTVGQPPMIEANDVYFYANDSEIVVVMIDPCFSDTFELADEERFNGNHPLWFSESGRRQSPVWQLAVTCELLRQRLLHLGKHIPEVWGLLVTSSAVLNSEDIFPVWEKLHVTVVRSEESLKPLSLPINEDVSLPLAFPLLFFYESEFNTDEVKAVEDHLQQLVADAVHSESHGQKSDDDADTETDIDTDTDADDDFLSEQDVSDFLFPEGIIQQNPNTQVKVQVLKPLANPHEELNKLVGCNGIKKRMDELVKMTRYNQLMKVLNPGGKLHKLSLHSVFFGRPGTGKSTVARILGSLLKEAGVLSKGHVIVCNRGTFVGTNWGDEERSVNQVVEMARGGVLMIDEAYLLSTQHPNDPGKLVIQLLMDLLADENQRDLAVVLCGYKDEMKNLISLNPGIDSRFPNRFEFKDFTLEELHEITRRRIREYGYRFSRAGWAKFKRVLEDSYNERDVYTWGNARFITNLLERVYCCHASRCVGLHNPDRKQILTITPADIEVPEPTASKAHIPQEIDPSQVHITGFWK